MLIIGSQAAIFHKLIDRKANDTDIIGTFDELQRLIRAVKVDQGISVSQPLDADHWHIRTKSGWNIEFEIAWPGSCAERLLIIEEAEEYKEAFASPEALLTLKLSHRFKKNSPHFLKTMQDIRAFRDKGVVIVYEEYEAWLKWREEETYTYKHPNLNVKKEDFFNGDDVPYKYDHDSIHETVATLVVPGGRYAPAYTFYMKDGSEVMTDKEKFFELPEYIRLLGVYEESAVLALERSLIPFNFEPDPNKMFLYALEKVCTSITSGWFREWAWENHQGVVALHDAIGHDWLVRSFKENQNLLRPFKQKV